MRTNRWFNGRRTAPVLVVCLLVWGAAPSPAAAQCELDKLLASDGAVNDQFGVSVSISGDVAVIGARLDDDNGNASGSAYVFQKPPGGWVNRTQTAKLTASDGAPGDFFGQSVSISGDVAVVGAYLDDAPLSTSGSAYVFLKPLGGWVTMTQTAKLTASDGAVSDLFGFSVSISGDVAVVGASADDARLSNSGSAYVFVKPVGGWVNMTETAKLTASDGAVDDQFGFSVSISGDVAVVGAYLDDDNGAQSGSAYVFLKPLGGWVSMTQTAKLTASDRAVGDNFGFSVSISGDVAVIGAWQLFTGPGSAYVFVGLLGLDYNGNGIADVCEALSGSDTTGPRGVPDGCVDAFDLGALLAAWCSVAGGNPCGTCGP